MAFVQEKCPRCFGRGAQCLCAQVRSVETRTRFVIIRHVLETSKASNTARLLALALGHCEVRAYAQPEEPLRLDDLAEEGTWLLYPGEAATPLPSPPPRRLILLDGSWSQARHMLQRLGVVRRLPRLSLPTAPDRVSLRLAPAGGMSTLETAAWAVELLEGAARAEPLHALHRAMVARARLAGSLR